MHHTYHDDWIKRMRQYRKGAIDETMQSTPHRKIITIAILNLILIGVEMSESYLKTINLTPETDAILTDLMAIEQSLNVVRNHIDGAKELLSTITKDDK